jgi:hypothetical protein
VLHPVERTEALEWTNPSGSVLVVAAPAKGHRNPVLGVLAGDRFIPIPGAPPVRQIAPFIAF